MNRLEIRDASAFTLAHICSSVTRLRDNLVNGFYRFDIELCSALI
jgi:hypothetical protein